MAFLSSLGVRVGLFGLMIVMLRSEGRMGGPAHVFPFPTSASAFSPDGRLKCPGFPPERESTTSPYARYHDLPWMRVRDWCLRFKRNILHPSRRGTELVFLGDSITEAWTEVAPDIWESYFGRYTPLKLGIPGDETQQVLWRIENGELDGLKPRVIVLLVGVNNLRNGEWSVAETAAGIEAVLHAIKKKLPEARVLHMALFPAMPSAQDPLRLKIEATNALLEKLRLPHVTFLDIGDALLEADGALTPEVMKDFIHPSREGYRRWGEKVAASLAITEGR